MKIEIEIPKEFENHFKRDRFEDSLRRLSADANLLAGNYEKEMVEALVKAFKDAKVLSEEKVVTPDMKRFMNQKIAVHIKNNDEYTKFVRAFKGTNLYKAENTAPDYELQTLFNCSFPYLFVEEPKTFETNAANDFDILKSMEFPWIKCIEYNDLDFVKEKEQSLDKLAAVINEYLDTEPNPDDRAGVIASLLHGEKLEDLIDMDKEPDDLER